MKKWPKADWRFVLVAFVVWRLALALFQWLGMEQLPLQSDFIAAGFRAETYTTNPWLWGWTNFDGQHYLHIARQGYRHLVYFYFPAYPYISRFIGGIIAHQPQEIVISGLLISHMSAAAALLGIYKITSLDYPKRIARRAVVLTLLWPGSFYLASFYTEALFLALSVWAFYLLRVGRPVFGGVLGAVSTATRLIGIAIIPAFWVESVVSKKSKRVSIFFGSMLIPLGLAAYMVFLSSIVGDPLAFSRDGEIFGEYRLGTPFSVPQALYRYLFKILPNLNYSYFFGTFTAYLELATALLLTIFSLVGFFKLRASYWVYLVISFLVPVHALNFVSLPRYTLSMFPFFILGSVLLESFPPVARNVVYAGLLIVLGIATAMFTRGYWVA